MNSDRKLATILATDCVNFSKHMEENEDIVIFMSMFEICFYPFRKSTT